jgi:hypothetical protein
VDVLLSNSAFKFNLRRYNVVLLPWLRGMAQMFQLDAR